MTACQRFAPMIGSREGELPPADAEALAQHLPTCSTCQAFAADVAATSGLFAEALLRRASTRDFAPFVDQVMARTGLDRQASPVRGLDPVTPWLRRRWRSLVVLAIPIVAAAGLFMYVRSELDTDAPEQLASLEISTEGGIGAVLQTKDGPVVLLEPDDESGS
jgi:anti-sigma factor RsiW